MSAPVILALLAIGAVAVGYPLHRRAVRKEKAREQWCEQAFLVLPHTPLADARADEVIAEAERLCMLDAWDLGSDGAA